MASRLAQAIHLCLNVRTGAKLLVQACSFAGDRFPKFIYLSTSPLEALINEFWASLDRGNIPRLKHLAGRISLLIGP